MKHISFSFARTVMRRVSKYEHKSYGPDREKKILTLRENLTNFYPFTLFPSQENLKKYALSVHDAETPASETKKRTHWSFLNKEVGIKFEQV